MLINNVGQLQQILLKVAQTKRAFGPTMGNGDGFMGGDGGGGVVTYQPKEYNTRRPSSAPPTKSKPTLLKEKDLTPGIPVRTEQNMSARKPNYFTNGSCADNFFMRPLQAPLHAISFGLLGQPEMKPTEYVYELRTDQYSGKPYYAKRMQYAPTEKQEAMNFALPWLIPYGGVAKGTAGIVRTGVNAVRGAKTVANGAKAAPQVASTVANGVRGAGQAAPVIADGVRGAGQAAPVVATVGRGAGQAAPAVANAGRAIPQATNTVANAGRGAGQAAPAVANAGRAIPQATNAAANAGAATQAETRTWLDLMYGRPAAQDPKTLAWQLWADEWGGIPRLMTKAQLRNDAMNGLVHDFGLNGGVNPTWFRNPFTYRVRPDLNILTDANTAANNLRKLIKPGEPISDAMWSGSTEIPNAVNNYVNAAGRYMNPSINRQGAAITGGGAAGVAGWDYFRNPDGITRGVVSYLNPWGTDTAGTSVQTPEGAEVPPYFWEDTEDLYEPPKNYGPGSWR